ncbi:hypothetical protein GH714_034678 [Hevea brasiliensis]|uniref:Uncharacterized protein n=1 Tax=Hevea brasiliensis TaxID=3981 RepID=A0A6A6NAX8_HEVBR|nr:hypothetical protein GH714_034678 [Hevea brasiliensis]
MSFLHRKSQFGFASDNFELASGFLGQTAPTGQSCGVKSLSSFLDARRGKDLRHVEEVLPANRSSLSTFKVNKDFKLKYSSGLICSEKSSLIYERENMQCQNQDRIDLTGKYVLDEIPSKEKLLVPYTAKKRKGYNSQHELKGQIESTQVHTSSAKRSHSNNPYSPFSLVMKPENPQLSDDGSRQNTQVVSVLPCKDHGQRELTAAEYKEFVGFMKALKSKAMKIGSVLESIVILFSGPDRRPLLRTYASVPCLIQGLQTYLF